MIGNDIVDLKYAVSSPHWNTQRFLDKVFSAEEQYLIKQSEDKLCTFWKLWSMKESAYKSFIQSNHAPFFAPLKIACQLNSDMTGVVTIGDTSYQTSSQITDNYIHTISYSCVTSEVISDIGRIDDTSYVNQHSKSYRSVLEAFASLLDTDSEFLRIKKTDSGIPVLFKNDIDQSIPLTISHHGNYYAYALINSPFSSISGHLL